MALPHKLARVLFLPGVFVLAPSVWVVWKERDHNFFEIRVAFTAPFWDPSVKSTRSTRPLVFDETTVSATAF